MIVDVFASFLQVLLSARVRRESEDNMWWVPSKRGLFKANMINIRGVNTMLW
jgi:hypothetical protein